MEPSRNLLTIGESAEYLRVSIDTLRRWEKRGRITPYRSPGGHRYYEKEELDTLFGKRYLRDEKQDTEKKQERKNEETPTRPSVQVERHFEHEFDEPREREEPMYPQYQPVEHNPMYRPPSRYFSEQNGRPHNTILIPPSPFTSAYEAPPHPAPIASSPLLGNIPKQLLSVNAKEKVQIIAIVVITALVVILAIVIFIFLIRSSRSVLSPSP